jgi:AraC-like DNA-binding protein
MIEGLSDRATLPTLDRQHLLVETRSRMLAEEHLGRVFTRHSLQVRRPANRLNFAHYHAQLGDLAINHIAYGAEVMIDAPGLPDFYLLQITLKGHCWISNGSEDITLAPGSVFIMNPNCAYRKVWGEDCVQLIVRIGRAEFEQRLANECGSSARHVAFRFAAAQPDAAKTIIRATGFLCEELGDPSSRLGQGGACKGFADMFLSLTLDGLSSDRSGIGAHVMSSPAIPYCVRRAETYMRANLLEDLSLADIASHAGVNRRTLNAGFRRFRGTTPITFLRDARLDLARLRLLAADPGANVTDIALACNLPHLGRFAQYYRQRFGERPSETLKRDLALPKRI